MTNIQEKTNSSVPTAVKKITIAGIISIISGILGLIVAVASSALGDDLMNTFLYGPLLFLIAVVITGVSMVFGIIDYAIVSGQQSELKKLRDSLEGEEKQAVEDLIEDMQPSMMGKIVWLIFLVMICSCPILLFLA